MTFGFSLALLSSLSAATIAAFAVIKAERSIVRWAFGIGMFVLAVEGLCSGMVADAATPDQVVVWETRAFVCSGFLPAVWLLFSVTYGRGSHTQSLKRWSLFLVLTFLLPVIGCLFFAKNFLVSVTALEGPTVLRVGPAGFALNMLLVVSWILVLMNLEATFRASVGTMRWRIKFMVLGLGVLFAVRIYSGTELLLFRSISVTRNDFNSAALLLACLLMFRSLLRTGHFEVSIYPSQSILQNSITLVLAGAYLIAVGILARIVVFLGGDTSFEIKAFLVLLALVLLAVVLLSDRVQLYIKHFASRHFQRPLHDYRTVWRLFTEGTTRRVEQEDLCQAVVMLVSEIFQALSVSIWVLDRDMQRLSLGASTSLLQSEEMELSLAPLELTNLTDALRNQREPINIDASEEVWAVALRRSHPSKFANGGSRLCVAMVAGGELLGILIVGDRVGGVPFGLQDIELLQCACNQAAAGLLNNQLAQRLSQSKQLEAFQAMSAFFVHDLKNTASTLSLMLHNLPLHYQDPEFREDAFRGISKTVAHIDHLISRLTVLRHDLALQPSDCNLNDLVVDLLKLHEKPPGIEIEMDLSKIPVASLDEAQIRKVLLNLLLNAQEASPNGGKVRIETGQRNGWIVLTVTDNGCGMSSEFIQRSLFRPFKSTKQRGLGIGMFHCKMIVEAHRGKIEVESKIGRGTSFRVLLPLPVRESRKL
ncbi:MAG TPA: XrtA/PEP-CTERM system histidine kinase PrsK [Verrucomicrobiae bacterium]|nr:XrtA/PEP-CTERM system histidine kinase PrsK [Verrucomicrobiae bacterium]